MTGFYSLIIPEFSINLVENPSIELNANGFTAVGGSVSRVTDKSRRGAYCLKITPTSGTGDGAYYGTVNLVSGTNYTFSVDVWAANGIPITIYFATTGGVQKGNPTDLTGNDDWQRVEVTWQADASASFRLYIIKDNSASTAAFYIDGLQVEAKSYATTYFDGDLDGCEWTKAKHASTSQRDGQSRAGGREYNLDTYEFYITETGGLGMPSLHHKTQPRALLPGAYYKGSRIESRIFDLMAEQIGTSRSNLHYQRQQLLDAIKPDLVKGEQPLLLKYTGANASKPVSIEAILDTGMGMGRLEGFSEKIAARFISWEDPFWYEEGDWAAHLTYSQEVTGADKLVAKIDNSWQVPSGTGANGTIYAFAEDQDGTIIAVGDFTSIGGTPANYIAYWDGEEWHAYSTGLPGTCYAVAVDPSGNIYAGGDTFAKKWNGSSWSDLGTGPNDIVYAIAIDYSGDVYLGGLFTSMNGVTVNYVCLWNGTTAEALVEGLGARVKTLAIGKEGYLYAGGYFTEDGEGNSADPDGYDFAYMAYWDGSEWHGMGSGMDSTVETLAVGINGYIFAGGFFTDPGNYIAYWNGSSWVSMGDGLNDAVYSIAVSPVTGIVFISGNFSSAGDLEITDRTALWNGYVFAPLDVTLPGSSHADVAFVSSGDDLYFGYSMTGSAYSSYVNTVANNGTRTAYPRIVFSRSGGTSVILKWLRNETTGATLFLNYSLLDGEKLTIDLRPGKREVKSNYFGRSLRALLRNSDFGQYFLLPGNNSISCFITEAGSPTVEAYEVWRNVHWSVDGVAEA